jgi:hypothetical protein
MPDLPLDICKNLPGIGLIPAPVQVLGRNTKLDYEIAGQVFRFNFSALFPPQPEERGFIVTHDDPSIGTPNKITAAIVLTMDSTHDYAFYEVTRMRSLGVINKKCLSELQLDVNKKC